MSQPLRQRLASQAMTRITGIKLTLRESQFVMEYSIDHNHRRAARAIGMNPDNGIEYLGRDNVQEAVGRVFIETMTPTQLNAEVVKEEMFKVYQVSMQEGNLSQAGRQLDMLAKHSHVDAYAAQKVAVSADAEIAAALRAGRQRVRDFNAVKDEEVQSFL